MFVISFLLLAVRFSSSHWTWALGADRPRDASASCLLPGNRFMLSACFHIYVNKIVKHVACGKRSNTRRPLLLPASSLHRTERSTQPVTGARLSRAADGAGRTDQPEEGAGLQEGLSPGSPGFIQHPLQTERKGTRCSWTIGLVVMSNQVLLTAQARSVCAAFRGRPRCSLGSQVPGFTRMLAVDSQRAREDPGKRCFRDGHSQDESYHGYYLPGDRCWSFLKGSGISLPVRDNFILVPKPS